MKKVVALILLLAIACSLVACSLKRDDLVGTYQRTWSYQGSTYKKTIVLMSNGKYTATTYKNGYFYKSEAGDWEIEGREVALYDSSASVYHGVATIYTYSNGKLKSGDSVYTKQ